MNVTHKHFIAVMAMSIVSSAAFSQTSSVKNFKITQAGDSSYPVLPSFASTKTRAQVHAELQQAREKGLIAITDSAYPVLPVETSNKTRSQVKTELEQSKASGEFKRLEKEQYSG